MTVTYGVRQPGREDDWGWDKEQAEWWCKLTGFVLLRRSGNELSKVTVL